MQISEIISKDVKNNDFQFRILWLFTYLDIFCLYNVLRAYMKC